jgi:hypothetical protein
VYSGLRRCYVHGAPPGLLAVLSLLHGVRRRSRFLSKTLSRTCPSQWTGGMSSLLPCQCLEFLPPAFQFAAVFQHAPFLFGILYRALYFCRLLISLRQRPHG